MQISIPALVKWLIALAVGQWLLLPDMTRGVFIGLVLLMVVDYISGVCEAGITRKLSSEIGTSGLLKKGLVMLALLSVLILERIAGLLGATAVSGLHMELVGAVGFSVNEVISIVENCAGAGVWMPKKVVRMLIAVQRLRGEGATPEDLAELRAGVRQAPAKQTKG